MIKVTFFRLFYQGESKKRFDLIFNCYTCICDLKFEVDKPGSPTLTYIIHASNINQFFQNNKGQNSVKKN